MRCGLIGEGIIRALSLQKHLAIQSMVFCLWFVYQDMSYSVMPAYYYPLYNEDDVPLFLCSGKP